MTVAAFMLGAYLLGSFPTSHLYGRLRGRDLRALGSGNLGATNAYRVFGPRAALLVAGVDLLKGFLPTWFLPLWDGSGASEWGLVYGFLAVVGHVWPVFTGFRGGKGVATAAGVLLALAPMAVLVGALVWSGLALITRLASVSSLTAASIVPAVAYLTEARGSTVLFGVVLAALVWVTHRQNLARLVRRHEPPLHRPAGPAPDRKRNGP